MSSGDMVTTRNLTDSQYLRHIADTLNTSLSTEIISDIKTKLISIADKIDNIPYFNIKEQDIDDILDEIDEKKESESTPKKEKTITPDFFSTDFFSNCSDFGRKFYGYPKQQGWTETMWLLLFKKLSDIDINTDDTIQWKPKCDEFIPFGGELENVSRDKLLEIYYEIPEEIRKQGCSKLANWWIERQHHKNGKRVNDVLFNKINRIFLNYLYWDEFVQLVTGKKSTIIAMKYYEDNQQFIDLNTRDITRHYCKARTLLHFGCMYGKDSTFTWIVCMDGIDEGIRDFNGQSAMDLAKDGGLWNKLNILLFAKMSNKMREQSDTEIEKLNGNKAIIKQWFRFYNVENNKSDEYKSMVKMVHSLKTLIEKRLPLSDDMLMIGLNFEMKQNGGNILQCSLWKCLYNTLNDILRPPLNRRNWLWFKQYI
eukprot:132989_1